MRLLNSLQGEWSLPPTPPPTEVGPGHVLPLIGYMKFGEEGPDFPLPKGIIHPMPSGPAPS